MPRPGRCLPIFAAFRTCRNRSIWCRSIPSRRNTGRDTTVSPKPPARLMGRHRRTHHLRPRAPVPPRRLHLDPCPRTDAPAACPHVAAMPGGAETHEQATDLHCIVWGLGVLQLRAAQEMGWAGHLGPRSRAFALALFLPLTRARGRRRPRPSRQPGRGAPAPGDPRPGEPSGPVTGALPLRRRRAPPPIAPRPFAR